MNIYAAERTLTFKPASIGQVRNLANLNEFFIFLDEFIADDWAVFVRNLSRAIGLLCVVANTNTKVANVIGKDTSSGGAGELIWSFVVCRLNGASKAILNSKFQLADSIKKIAHRLEPELLAGSTNEDFYHRLQRSTNPVIKFLSTLNDALIEQMRPGIAVFVARALETYVATNLNDPAFSVTGEKAHYEGFH